MPVSAPLSMRELNAAANVHRGDALRWLRARPADERWDVVFLDPPFESTAARRRFAAGCRQTGKRRRDVRRDRCRFRHRRDRTADRALDGPAFACRRVALWLCCDTTDNQQTDLITRSATCVCPIASLQRPIHRTQRNSRSAGVKQRWNQALNVYQGSFNEKRPTVHSMYHFHGRFPRLAIRPRPGQSQPVVAHRSRQPYPLDLHRVMPDSYLDYIVPAQGASACWPCVEVRDGFNVLLVRLRANILEHSLHRPWKLDDERRLSRQFRIPVTYDDHQDIVERGTLGLFDIGDRCRRHLRRQWSILSTSRVREIASTSCRAALAEFVRPRRGGWLQRPARRLRPLEKHPHSSSAALRTISDFDYEYQMITMNREMQPDLDGTSDCCQPSRQWSVPVVLTRFNARSQDLGGNIGPSCGTPRRGGVLGGTAASSGTSAGSAGSRPSRGRSAGLPSRSSRSAGKALHAAPVNAELVARSSPVAHRSATKSLQRGAAALDGAHKRVALIASASAASRGRDRRPAATPGRIPAMNSASLA